MKKLFIVLLIVCICPFANAQELKLFKDIYPGAKDSRSAEFFQTDDYLFFLSSNISGTDHPTLWMMDDNGSTNALLDIDGTYRNIKAIKASNNTAYFFYGSTLFITNGTTVGTRRLQTPKYTYTYYGGNTSIVYKDKLFFTASDNEDTANLWVSDGTKLGTKQLKVFKKRENPSPFRFFELNGILYFSAHKALWKTDGTEAGTVLVNDFLPDGSEFGEIFGVYQNHLILLIQHRTYGYELWTTDGTVKGTTLIKDINQKKPSLWSGNSNPKSFTVFNNKMFFTADDGIHGRELWTSDGTEAGTQLLMDINKSDTYYYQSSSEFHVTNDLLYFNAYDEMNGYELWKTDGTEAGTKMVKSIAADKDKSPKNFVSIGNALFFIADNGNGEEVYITDGTESGTKIMEPKNRTELEPFSNLRWSMSIPLFVFKEKLYVSGDYEADYGLELYMYNPNDNTSGVQSLAQNNFHIFPNPATNEIQAKGNDFSLLKIYDLNGKLLLETKDVNSKINIDFLAAGMYLIQLSNDKTQVSERFIKQ